MSKFKQLIESILLNETDQPKFDSGDIVKAGNSVGTIANSFLIHGILVYNVQFIIPNISGPYEDKNGNTVYICKDEKPYTTKIKQIAEEFLQPATKEELNTVKEKATIETNKWK